MCPRSFSKLVFSCILFSSSSRDDGWSCPCDILRLRSFGAKCVAFRALCHGCSSARRLRPNRMCSRLRLSVTRRSNLRPSRRSSSFQHGMDFVKRRLLIGFAANKSHLVLLDVVQLRGLVMTVAWCDHFALYGINIGCDCDMI